MLYRRWKCKAKCFNLAKKRKKWVCPGRSVDGPTHGLAVPESELMRAGRDACPRPGDDGRGQVLPAFLLFSTLLVMKINVVAVITGQVRLWKKAFAYLRCPEIWRPPVLSE